MQFLYNMKQFGVLLITESELQMAMDLIDTGILYPVKIGKQWTTRLGHEGMGYLFLLPSMLRVKST